MRANPGAHVIGQAQPDRIEHRFTGQITIVQQPRFLIVAPAPHQVIQAVFLHVHAASDDLHARRDSARLIILDVRQHFGQVRRFSALDKRLPKPGIDNRLNDIRIGPLLGCGQLVRQQPPRGPLRHQTGKPKRCGQPVLWILIYHVTVEYRILHPLGLA